MTMPDHTGRIYLVELSNGFIKVGMTKVDPETRFATHRRFAEKIGCEIVRTWTSRVVKQKRDDELAVLEFCKNSGGVEVQGYEWFSGLNYEAVHSFAVANVENIPCDEKPYNFYVKYAHIFDEARIERNKKEMRMAAKRLRAAAADMLEALECVISHGCMTGDDWVVEKVLAAVSKAKGEGE